MTIKLSYVAPLLDCSGYSEAARNNVLALNSVGVRVFGRPVSFEKFKCYQGRHTEAIQQIIKDKIEHKIQIIHLTPEHYSKLYDSTKYNIGYAAWETDRLPDKWIDQINLLDEIWVPSEFCVQAFKESGVTIPVIRIPHAFDEEPEESISNGSIIKNKKEDEFAFYSVFQWLERKNPIGLLKAYLTEFSSKDKVVLVLKTYLINPTEEKQVNFIREQIKRAKTELHMKDFPKILLITSLLSRPDINALHNECDCYISLHRCEGFGIPIAEAMLQKKPVIATGLGGPQDFIQHGETGYIVDYMMTPVSGMPWEIYTGKMSWAEPDLLQARKFMREVYTDRKAARKMGARGEKWVKENLSWEKVGTLMKERLEEICTKI